MVTRLISGRHSLRRRITPAAPFLAEKGTARPSASTTSRAVTGGEARVQIAASFLARMRQGFLAHGSPSQRETKS
jgi:hypothetical protein